MNSHVVPSSSVPPDATSAAIFPTEQAFEHSLDQAFEPAIRRSAVIETAKVDVKDGQEPGADAGAADPACFPLDRDTLYSEFAPLVRRLIRQYGDNAELRQDLAGEIYYRFCLLLDAYDPARGVPLRPYLVRQLSASIYTYARHQWRRARRETSLSPSSLLENGSLCEPAHPCDPTSQWDNNLATEQALKELPEAIAGLPKRQRQVVIWRYYDQRSFEEIAERLQVQTATARSLLRHGLNNLRRWVSNNQLLSEDE